MAYTFIITGINRLPGARVGVLGGKLLDGVVTTGSTAKLVHGSQLIPVQVKGVLIDSSRPRKEALSLTVDLRQAAMKLVAIGDILVSA